MLKKVTAEEIEREEQQNVTAGERVLYVQIDACEYYCHSHCGTMPCSESHLSSGQDFYQS
ncbi:MAG: hypothetical protein QG657_236 [Acidobacteriota bacterium]|nr:hypothetical protein [Acidobacteriota bacterium]